MIIMSLDHASQAWNAGRPMPEIAGFGPVDYGGVLQQLTRELTHVCAPGFQFLAGMGLAISVLRRQRAGQPEWLISGDMLLRGAVLLFCDFALMHFAYDRIPFFFLVLACIGGSTILFSALRKLPIAIILLFGAGSIFLAPLLVEGRVVEPSASSFLWNALINVALTESPDNLAFLVLYPVFPWVGCFGVGWCVGTVFERNEGEHLRRITRGSSLTTIGLAMFVTAWLLRALGGSYADQHPVGDGFASPHFWTLTKYPPSPVFLLGMLGLNLALVGALRPLDDGRRPGWRWRIPLVFGHVSLFYFVVHMYLYGAYPVVTNTVQSYGLATTYVVWLAGLVLMFPLCLAYGALRHRCRTVLRYF